MDMRRVTPMKHSFPTMTDFANQIAPCGTKNESLEIGNGGWRECVGPGGMWQQR